MKFLITGCNGFIGSKLTRKLCESGHEVIGLDTRSVLSDLNQLSNFSFLELDIEVDEIPDLALLKIDGVIHLAVSMSPKPDESFEHLLQGTHRLLQAMQDAKTPRLLGMSSLSVLDFESLEAGGLVDENISRCNQYGRMGKYAALKSMQEAVFIDYAKNYWASVVITRPGLVYESGKLNNAYAGIVKGNRALIIKSDGQIPVVEVSSLIEGLLAAANQPLKSASYFCVNFVEDNLPSQSDYIARLRDYNLLPQRYFSIDWRCFNFFVQQAYRLFKALKLEQHLPSLLMPQAFATRLKPFVYSNQMAKSLLGWNPNQFK